MHCADSEGGVETFIVRIYRRDPPSVDELVGTVECVGSGERQGFVGRAELWDRLFVAGTQGQETTPDSGAENE